MIDLATTLKSWPGYCEDKKLSYVYLGSNPDSSVAWSVS